MPMIVPMARSLLYDPGDVSSSHGRDITTKIAPPYDLVDESTRAALLAADEENIAAIDVPHIPPRDAGPQERYVAADERLRELVEAKSIVQSDEPRLFVVRQTFVEREHGLWRRFSLVGSLNLPKSRITGQTGIHAHEETEAGVCDDRLALLRACRTQTSPIFGLYSDPAGRVEDRLREVMLNSDPILSGVAPDRTLHEVWEVSDAAQIARLVRGFGDREVIIADGHHRVESMRQFFDEAEASGDSIDRSVMFALIATQDLGMNVRPVHRMFSGVRDLSIERLREAAGASLQIEEASGDLAEFRRQLAQAAYQSPHPMGLIEYATGRTFIAVCSDLDPLRSAFPDRPSSWRRMPAVICQEFLNRDILRQRINGGEPIERRSAFSYRDLFAAGDHDDPPQLGVAVQPAPLQEILDLASAGHLLPAESTFFWPKVATGLMMKPIR